MNRRLAVAIAAWTLLAWVGRIGLLVGGEGLASWLRIGGSLLVGLFAAITLLVPRLEPVRRPALIVFAVFTMLLWARSLYVNWTGSGSLPFKMVHTVLALGFFALALWALAAARSPVPTGGHPVPGPDEADREQQAEGEATGFAKG
jgi:hypothetical protein